MAYFFKLIHIHQMEMCYTTASIMSFTLAHVNLAFIVLGKQQSFDCLAGNVLHPCTNSLLYFQKMWSGTTITGLGRENLQSTDQSFGTPPLSPLNLMAFIHRS